MPDDQRSIAASMDGDSSRIVIEVEESSLGAAVVVNDGRFRQLRFESAQGHVPVTACREPVDAVFALPESAFPCIVQAAIPIGDGELRTRLADVNTRAAGATCSHRPSWQNWENDHDEAQR
jgi:hypothetical protein